jgi:branched-chain amino acid transport system permease protein
MDGYVGQVAIVAAINSIVALGLYITVLSGQWSVAHAAFMGIGAYGGGLLSRDTDLPFVAVLLSAFVLSAAIGGALSLIMTKLTSLFSAIITVVFAQAAVVAVSNIPGLGGATGLYPIPIRAEWWLILGILLLAMVVAWRLDKSDWGFSSRTGGEDPELAASMGISVTKIRFQGLALGSGMAGVAGALLISQVGIIEPSSLGFVPSLLFFVYVVVGGITVWYGSVLGATLLTVLPEVLRFGAGYRYILMGAVLLVVMLVRPEGIVKRRPLRSATALRAGAAPWRNRSAAVSGAGD